MSSVAQVTESAPAYIGIGAELAVEGVVKTYRRAGRQPFNALDHVSTAR